MLENIGTEAKSAEISSLGRLLRRYLKEIRISLPPPIACGPNKLPSKDGNLIHTARGEKLADLVIKNAKLINVLSEEIYDTDIAITDGVIVGLGGDYEGKEYIDAKGAYVSPSFIDGHVHMESSMVLPKEFAKAVLPAGTTTVITDPHEIANVYGVDGINFMREATKDISLSVYFMLPSCVPATPFETSNYEIKAKDLKELIDKPWVLGLAEMMNYIGTINCDKDILDKISMTKDAHKIVDGHSPLLSGKELNAYVVSGVKSDHECETAKEAKEKIRLGMYIMIREGTAAKNLDSLMPVLKDFNTRKCCFVTDDRGPFDLHEHINGMVRRCVENGVDIIKAIQCASLNTAEYFGLKDLGAIAPGYRADLLILDDIISFKPKIVLKGGKIVAKDGKYLATIDDIATPKYVPSVKVKGLTLDSFKIVNNSNLVKTIGIQDGELVTESLQSEALLVNGCLVSNIANDTLKICVIERHRQTGNIGKGFIKGFNLKFGAIASTVAHDSHNIVVVGTNDADMYFAAQTLIKSNGGKIVVKDGKILSHLELPIAGLISDKNIEDVLQGCESLKKAEKEIGCTLRDSFMTMGFVSLSVIPNLKITDKGVFEYKSFSFVEIVKDGY